MTNDNPSNVAHHNPIPFHNGAHPARDGDVDRGAQAVGRAKFNLGLGHGTLPSEQIPWGYGESIVKAMARDPDWLYVYWEITDEAIGDARQRLGHDPIETHCCLRIYDASARGFDAGDPACHTAITVDRCTRDWFVHVGKPCSSCYVEIGVQSVDGAFEPIARSGRADFPAKGPTQNRSVEWLTVEEAGPNDDSFVGVVGTVASPSPGPVVSVRHEHPSLSRNECPAHGADVPRPTVETRGHHIVPYRVIVDRHVERRETRNRTWTEQRAFAWSSRVSHRFEVAHEVSPQFFESWRMDWLRDRQTFAWMVPLRCLTYSYGPVRTTWETAPCLDDFSAVDHVCMQMVSEGAVLHHVSGFQSLAVDPWEVVVRGLTLGEPLRRSFGRWIVRRVLAVVGGEERWTTTVESKVYDTFEHDHITLGASEMHAAHEHGASELWLVHGSEQLWFGASDSLAFGGSEQLLLGASELRLAGVGELTTYWEALWQGASEWISQASSSVLAGGSSEVFFLGASEEHGMGASETFAFGASEWLTAGASETLVFGASEVLTFGASETLVFGASELLTLGASETYAMLGSSEAFAIGASEVSAMGASEAFAFGAREASLFGAIEQLSDSTVLEVLSQSSSAQFAAHSICGGCGNANQPMLASDGVCCPNGSSEHNSTPCCKVHGLVNDDATQDATQDATEKDCC